jgi:predicted TIM-barrel fold metal-dependent hydrolase
MTQTPPPPAKPRAAPPTATPVPPKAPIPPGACDSHVHIVGGAADFPLWEGRVEDPAEGDFEAWMARLAAHLAALGMARVVVVHSILYGGDNAITLEATRRLGPERARAIALVRDDASEAALDALAAAGVAGVRLNYVHGGLLSWEGAIALAPRLAARGMHLQMLMQADAHAEDLEEAVRALPVPVVFDHIGWPDLAKGTSGPGFRALCRMVAEGHAYVKLSGLYRVCDAPYAVAADHVAALVAANPERCLWGSDWPHLMLADAKMPDAGALLNAFLDVVPGHDTRQRILSGNPAALYGFAPVPDKP